MAPSSSPPEMKELDLVWARQKGYPWWPAVLSPCPVQPNMGNWTAGTGKRVKFHCTYVGWDKQRVWLEEKDIRKFKREDLGQERKKEYIVKNKQYREQHLEALELVVDILDDPNNPLGHLVKIKEDFNENRVDQGMDNGLIKEKLQIGNILEETKEESKHKEVKPAIKNKKISRNDKKKITPVRMNVIADPNKTKVGNKDDKEAKFIDVNKVEESFFHTIAEKVKNPRKRKPVEKFNPFDEINVGKIGKIKKFLSKQLPQASSQILVTAKITAVSPPSSLLPSATAACQCAGCLLADCGQCKFCEDKICFGGEGKLKQRCGRRMCHKKGILFLREGRSDVTNVNTSVLEDGVDILKVANKGKKSEISEMVEVVKAESSDEEVPLVINLDAATIEEIKNNTASNTVHASCFPTSPTQYELPTSSTISYKKSENNNVVASNSSVWEDVKISLLDVQDSLADETEVVKDSLVSDVNTKDTIKDNVDVSDSSDDEFDISIHPSMSLLLTSPSPLSNSSITFTISTPTQSPDRVEEDFVTDDDVNPVESFIDEEQASNTEDPPAKFFHSDWIDDIIELNIMNEGLYAVTEDNNDNSGKKVKMTVAEISRNEKPKSINNKMSIAKNLELKGKSKKSVSFKPRDTIAYAPENVNDAKELQLKDSNKKVTEVDLFSGSYVKKKTFPVNISTVEGKLKVSEDKERDKGDKDLLEMDKGDKDLLKVVKDVKKKMKDCLEKVKDVKKIKASNCTKSKDTKLSESKGIKNPKQSTIKSKTIVKVLSEKKSKNDKKKSSNRINKKTEGTSTFPESLMPTLGSFKIPKSKPKMKKVEKEEVKNDKKAKEDYKNLKHGDEKNLKRKSEDKNSDKHSKRSKKVKDIKKEGSDGSKTIDFSRKGTVKSESEDSKITQSASNWVEAVDWSCQVAPDSTTGDEPLDDIQINKKATIVDAESDCSSDSGDEDASWKRKKLKIGKKELRGNEKVKSLMVHQRLQTESRSSSKQNLESSPSSQTLPVYTMSLKILDKLESNSVFDSHCHMDFILFQRLPHMELESFDQFLHQFPLMSHPSLEGFITNFCSPRLWMEHLSTPTPLVHSLLARSSVYYTLGCHPHFTRDLLVPRNYRLLEQLLEKAGPRCVAVGECGLDTSGKNTTRMADQLEAFKMQVKLAIRMKKPLVLHIRGAEKEAIKALYEVKLPLDWPIHRHCWNDTWAVCQEWMAIFTNSVVGITPLVTFSNTLDLQIVSKKLPMDRIVLETDAPYFLPRGGGREGFLGHTTNEFSLPIHVVNVAAQVAAIRECNVEEVLRASRENIARVYNV